MAKVKATRITSAASKVTKIMDQWIKELNSDEELKNADDIIATPPLYDKYDKFIESKQLTRFFNLFNESDLCTKFILSVKEDKCIKSTNKKYYLHILNSVSFNLLFIRYHCYSESTNGVSLVITHDDIKSVVESYEILTLDNGDVYMTRPDFWDCIEDIISRKCGKIYISDTDESGYPIMLPKIHSSNVSKYLDLSLNHTLFERHLKYEDLISCEVESSSGISHNVMAHYRFPISKNDHICVGRIRNDILTDIINRAFGCIPPYSTSICVNNENIDITVSFNNYNDVKDGVLPNSKIRTDSVLAFITLMLRANYITRLHNKLLVAIGNMALYSTTIE